MLISTRSNFAVDGTRPNLNGLIQAILDANLLDRVVAKKILYFIYLC